MHSKMRSMPPLISRSYRCCCSLARVLRWETIIATIIYRLLCKSSVFIIHKRRVSAKLFNLYSSVSTTSIFTPNYCLPSCAHPRAHSAVLLPWRSLAASGHVAAVAAADPDRGAAEYSARARWAIVENARIALLDVVIVPLGVVATLLPWRTAAVVAHYRACLADAASSSASASSASSASSVAADYRRDEARVPEDAIAAAPANDDDVDDDDDDANAISKAPRRVAPAPAPAPAPEASSYFCFPLRLAMLQNFALTLLDLVAVPVGLVSGT